MFANLKDSPTHQTCSLEDPGSSAGRGTGYREVFCGFCPHMPLPLQPLSIHCIYNHLIISFNAIQVLILTERHMSQGV